MTLIQAGDVGLNIRVSVGKALTGYDECLIKVLNPDGTKSDWTPDSIDTDDGFLNYETVVGNLEDSGDYVIQSYVLFTDGEVRYGEAVRFHVYENLVA